MNEVKPFDFSDNKNFFEKINFSPKSDFIENRRRGQRKLPITGVVDRKFMGPISMHGTPFSKLASNAHSISFGLEPAFH